MNVETMTAEELFEFAKKQSKIIYPDAHGTEFNDTYRAGRLAFECGVLRGIITQLVYQRDGK